jgi:hypothetical protein
MRHRMNLWMTGSATRSQARTAIYLVLVLSSALVRGHAQGKPSSEPDVVVFPNGEKLIGHLESFTGGSAKFKSDTLGEITIDLNKVQELRTSEKFAVVRKNLQLAKGETDGQVPRGTILVTNQKVEVHPENGQPAQTLGFGDLGYIVDEGSFEKAFRRPSIFADWKGVIAVGSSIVEATQNSVSFNTSVGFVRAVPTETWLAPRDRTTIDFSDSYGKVTQPGTPTVKTSIYHADAERDQYLKSRVYALGSVAFDHNFSQGLDLQQIYGGGIGWTVIQKPSQTLDLKGMIDYERQQFQVPAENQNLAGSIFAELYKVKFANNILISEQLSASPAWTNTHAYSGYASAGILLPVYKRFGFTANVIDSFLNNPPPGFKKNSVQFTTGLSYSIQ